MNTATLIQSLIENPSQHYRDSSFYKTHEQELFNMHSDEFDWVESCKDLAKKKLRSKLPEGKEKEKILRFLSYRGFNYEIIKSALNNLD